MSGAGGDVDYDAAAGTGYALRRRADPRIAELLHAALGDARTVLNVGAGAGSYEPADRDVVAVEPSAAMRAQRPPGAARVVDAVAEDLPFPDGTFDAAMGVYTLHQWPDLERGLADLRRVTRGPIVLLTSDPDALAGYWLADYAPELIAAERRRMPSIATLTAALGPATDVVPVPVPADCADGFAEAFYARPERLLDDAVRRAQSAWSFIPAVAQARAVARLRDDLASGAWDARYGALRAQPTWVGSLRLVIGRRSHHARGAEPEPTA